MKKLIGKYVRPFLGEIFGGFLIKFAGTIVDLFIPYILAYIIDYVIPQKDFKKVFIFGALMLLCSLLALIFNIIANRKASKVAGKSIEWIRHDLFDKIMHLSNRHTDEFTKPSLVSRMTSDTYNLHVMFCRIQRLGIRAPILLIGGIIVTFTMDVQMALILVASLPVLAFITFFVSKKSIPMFRALQVSTDNMVRTVRENISGIRVIKALSKTDYENERFKKINKEVVDQERKNGMLMAVVSPTMNLLLNIGLILVIIVGAYRVNSGETQVGKILAFSTYFTVILHTLVMISRMVTTISKAAASGNRIQQVLDASSDMEVMECLEEEANVSNRNAKIVFDNVTFAYNKGKKATVKNISFSVNKGETIGIIGQIGSGKTTLINLMMRLYDTDEGRVFIDGKDIRSYKPETLKKKFGVVFQNDTIFEDTISNNVSLGRDMDADAVRQALHHAMADKFVLGREEKEEGALNIKGANLSGGQKQRVLIARALAAHPEILILDDSTSALDYKTDALLRSAIREFYSDVTVVMVAQRVSSIKNAEHILVLEDGECIGYGNHETLMEECEVYREIANSQLGEVQAV